MHPLANSVYLVSLFHFPLKVDGLRKWGEGGGIVYKPNAHSNQIEQMRGRGKREGNPQQDICVLRKVSCRFALNRYLSLFHIQVGSTVSRDQIVSCFWLESILSHLLLRGERR